MAKRSAIGRSSPTRDEEHESDEEALEMPHQTASDCEIRKSAWADPKEELKRFAEFGLGRGADATDPSPFANKKSFQIRPLYSEDSIICTDEGGALHSIFQKLETSDTHAIMLSASVPLPKTPIQIGAAVEHSQSTTRRGYTIGRKVITRNVAFRVGYHAKEEGESGKCVKEETEPKSHFENWLEQTHTCKVNELLKFITKYGITHYVSKIHLGSAEYRTMSEMHYSSFIKGKQNVGVDKIAELALSTSKKHTSSLHVSETKRIGLMSDKYVVRRGTYDEAVVDVQLESIASLIKNDDLRKALTKALCIYVGTRGFNRIGYQEADHQIIASWLKDSIGGDECDGGNGIDAFTEIRKLELPPSKHDETHKYAICCRHGKDMLFLDIHDSNEVVAWKLVDANPNINYFSLKCTERPGEFILMDYDDFSVETKTLHSGPKLNYDFWPTPRYLKVKTTLGVHRGPLRMKISADEYYCRLTLRPRLFHQHSHVSMSDVTNGKDMFYICTSRRHGKTGYLYVKDRGDGIETKPSKAGAGRGVKGNTCVVEEDGPVKCVTERVTDMADKANRHGQLDDAVRVHCINTPEIEHSEDRGDVIEMKASKGIAAVEMDGPVENIDQARDKRDTDMIDDASRVQYEGERHPRYVLACKPSIKGGNADECMLFRLVRFESMYIPDSA